MSLPLVTIITPCFNEDLIIGRFLADLEGVLAHLPFAFHVVVVDDCSTDNTKTILNDYHATAANVTLRTVSLSSNQGHQAAIYEGLAHACELQCGHFIVMDSDGQDSPDVIPSLLACRDADIVHVVRARRSESLLFRVLYRMYKGAFRLVTGQRMNYGNFCLIRRHVLEMAVADGFVHFPAFLARQNLAKRFIPANREKRLGGSSKMSPGKLCVHALRSVAEYRNVPKPARLLPLLAIILSMACNNSTIPKTTETPPKIDSFSRSTTPKTTETLLKIDSFSLFIYKYERYLASGYGYTYRFTQDSLDIGYHHMPNFDSSIIRIKLNPSLELKKLSELDVDTLHSWYHNPNISSGYQYYFTFRKNGKEKNVQVENYYVPVIEQLISLADSLLPYEYQIGYSKEMFNFDFDTSKSIKIPGQSYSGKRRSKKK